MQRVILFIFMLQILMEVFQHQQNLSLTNILILVGRLLILLTKDFQEQEQKLLELQEPELGKLVLVQL